MKQLLFSLLISISLLPASYAQQAPTEKVKQIPGTTNVHEELPINSLLPSFHFVTYKENFITESNLPKGRPTIMALFNPNCDHCLKATLAIKEKMESFYNVNIVLVTSIINFGELKDFVMNAELARYSNVFVCATQDSYISKTFMPNWILPQVMVYNKDRKLKKIFYETVQTDSLLHYLFK